MGDDSYCGQPVKGWGSAWSETSRDHDSHGGDTHAGFDDSQGAGIAAFKASTSLKPSGPADFGFLLGQN